MKKRGVIEIQFNWIFVMIAGAIILLFFTMMVSKQRDVSEVRSQINFQNNLQTILVGAEIDKNTLNVVNVPNREIEYSCEGFSIASLGSFNQRVTFAPNLIKSKTRQIITLSLDWRVPFRATNFLYVTSPEVKYYVVVDDNSDDGSIGNHLFNLLPEKLDKEIITAMPTINEGNYKVKFIFFTTHSTLPSTFDIDDEDVGAIRINGELDGIGDISFYKGGTFSLDGNAEYLKKEMLLGAVFAENKEIYDCQVEKAKESLSKVADVYLKRIEEIVSDYGSDNCGTMYGGAIINLNVLNDISSSLFTINTKLEDLEKENKKVQRSSCALIY